VKAAFLALAVAAAAGAWQAVPASPVHADGARSAVWTGRQVLVFGRHSIMGKDARGNPYAIKTVDVAAAFDPAGKTWRKLTPPAGAGYSPNESVVWTGKRLLAWGPFDLLSYDPARNAWQRLPNPPTNAGRLAVWTGKEFVGWGGGCCGDAFSDGAAFNPATRRWRKLPASPLAGSQRPVGAWTGRELVLFVGNLDPDGKPWPAKLARAAAYNPATNTWRRLTPHPGRLGTFAVWDGRELLLPGFAFDPAKNAWRRAHVPGGSLAVWTGSRLLVLNGRAAVSYDPARDRATSLATSQFAPEAAAWTGRSLFVWNGTKAAVLTP
jgi:hypothetical protein